MSGNDIATLLPPGMTEDEANFLYNVEVLGLPARKAASMAGMPVTKISAPHIIQSRELVKKSMRGAMQITKEDVVYGMSDAIYRAKLLCEPMTEIIGWEKIAKLLGYDQPQKIDINIHASIEVQQQQVRGMSDAELIKHLGAGAIIDAEFYELGN